MEFGVALARCMLLLLILLATTRAQASWTRTFDDITSATLEAPNTSPNILANLIDAKNSALLESSSKQESSSSTTNTIMPSTSTTLRATTLQEITSTPMENTQTTTTKVQEEESTEETVTKSTQEVTTSTQEEELITGSTTEVTTSTEEEEFTTGSTTEKTTSTEEEAFTTESTTKVTTSTEEEEFTTGSTTEVTTSTEEEEFTAESTTEVTASTQEEEPTTGSTIEEKTSTEEQTTISTTEEITPTTTESSTEATTMEITSTEEETTESTTRSTRSTTEEETTPEYTTDSTETTTEDLCTDYVPGIVRDINAQFIAHTPNNNTVIYHWGAPIHGSGCLATRYDVAITYLGDVERHVTTTPFLWTDEQPSCQQVKVEVTASAGGGEGGTSTVVLSIGDGDPSAVRIMKTGATQNAINITFAPPQHNPTCVDSYAVAYRAVKPVIGREIVTFTHARSAQLSALQPCVTYRVQVSPVWRGVAVHTQVRPRNVRTDDADLGAPTRLTVSQVDEHSASFNWLPPENAPLCVHGYNVRLLDEDGVEVENFNTTSTTAIVTNLFSCSTYLLEVRAQGDNNAASEPAIYNFDTSVEAPPVPVNGTVKSLGSRWVELKWSVPEGSTDNELNSCLADWLNVTCISDMDEVKDAALVYSSIVILNVTDLRPYTNYTCRARLVNTELSQESDAVHVTTDEEKPGPPQNVRIDSVTPHGFTVRWEPPAEKVGEITHYLITVNCSLDDLPTAPPTSTSRPPTLKPGSIRVTPTPVAIATTTWEICPPDDRCQFETVQYSLNMTSPGVELKFEVEASAFSRHEVNVQAVTSAGEGDTSAPQSTVTLPKASGPVVNIVAETKYENNFTRSGLILTWQAPCMVYGNLNYFEVTLWGERPGFEDFMDKCKVYDFELEVNDLLPEFNFTVLINTIVHDVLENGIPGNTTFITPAGAPPQPEDGSHLYIQPDPGATDDPSTQARIMLYPELFNEESGTILYWAVLIGTKQILGPPKFGLIEGAPTLDSWKQSNAGTKQMYQATPDSWNPFMQRNSSGNVTFVVGVDGSCALKPDSEFCNGPLKSGTEYGVVIRGFTKNGFRDTEHNLFITESALTTSVALIVSCVVVAVLILAITGALVVARRTKPAWSRKLVATVFGDMASKQAPVRALYPSSILAERFHIHCDSLERTTGPVGETRLAEEFRLLGNLSPSPPAVQPSAYSVAMLQDNRPKNRYVNILPYDESRVKLSIQDDDPSSEYVNASFIKGYSGEVEYIASQGPKLDTCEDFWRMVFEHDVTLLVMVTHLVEKGKEKCHRYFPELRDTLDFGFISVKCVTEINFSVYSSRTLLVQKESLQKTVVQLQFREWPDFGCPSSPELMLTFVQTMRQHVTLNPGLVLVHCSAGVGRTGTLIAVDILVQHVRENKKLDVFNTVLNLRQQRINMVQTEGQYNYIHQCLRDAIENVTLFNSGVSTTNSLEPIYANISPMLQAELEAETLAIAIDESKVFSNESCM